MVGLEAESFAHYSSLRQPGSPGSTLRGGGSLGPAALRPPLSKGLPLSVPLFALLWPAGCGWSLHTAHSIPFAHPNERRLADITCSGGLAGEGPVKPATATLRPAIACRCLAAQHTLWYPGVWGG